MPANSRYSGRGKRRAGGGGGGGYGGDDSVMFAFDLWCLLFLFPAPATFSRLFPAPATFSRPFLLPRYRPRSS